MCPSRVDFDVRGFLGTNLFITPNKDITNEIYKRSTNFVQTFVVSYAFDINNYDNDEGLQTVYS
jgi:hypothetical protein